jgi:hypothetical protein
LLWKVWSLEMWLILDVDVSEDVVPSSDEGRMTSCEHTETTVNKFASQSYCEPTMEPIVPPEQNTSDAPSSKDKGKGTQGKPQVRKTENVRPTNRNWKSKSYSNPKTLNAQPSPAKINKESDHQVSTSYQKSPPSAEIEPPTTPNVADSDEQDSVIAHPDFREATSMEDNALFSIPGSPPTLTAPPGTPVTPKREIKLVTSTCRAAEWFMHGLVSLSKPIDEFVGDQNRTEEVSNQTSLKEGILTDVTPEDDPGKYEDIALKDTEIVGIQDITEENFGNGMSIYLFPFL